MSACPPVPPLRGRVPTRPSFSRLNSISFTDGPHLLCPFILQWTRGCLHRSAAEDVAVLSPCLRCFGGSTCFFSLKHSEAPLCFLSCAAHPGAAGHGQAPVCVQFSVLYQLRAGSAPASQILGLGFLPRETGAAAGGGRGALPVTWLRGCPEIWVLQQPELCREAEYHPELDRPAVEVPLTPGTPSRLLSLQDARCAVSTLPHQAPGIRDSLPTRGHRCLTPDPKTLHQAGPELGRGSGFRVLTLIPEATQGDRLPSPQLSQPSGNSIFY